MPVRVLKLSFGHGDMRKRGELEIIVEGLDALKRSGGVSQELFVAEEAIMKWPFDDGSYPIRMTQI